ncbi:MAG: hypothetical protein RIE77_12720 [Phycisphaerales bacterium]|jgi:hypothetical protein
MTSSDLKISASALAEIEQALHSYHDQVESSSMAENTKKTYLRHADTFVRWLKGDFEPGERVSL